VVRGSARPERRSARRRQALRRRRAAVAIVLVGGYVLIAWLTGTRLSTHNGSTQVASGHASRSRSARSPERFLVRRLPVTLPVALQDAAGVPLGRGRAALLGGLNAADSSTATVSVLDRSGVTVAASLPEAQHDAQGATLDGLAYVFGGGQFSSDDHILSYDPATDTVTQVGTLPTPTSDAAVATLAGVAYIIGGYDGQHALDTIIAWRPGGRPQLVARLPYALRYAAAAASDGRVLIAGGSRDEAATSAILSYNPATRKLRHIGNLPEPITHGAAVALGFYTYILGGRGSAPGSQSASVFAIDAGTGRTVRVGQLPRPLSDAAAIPIDNRVWLAGGLDPSGPVDSVLELTPVPL
jgi:N-acetylneuraminic acid mutarotase